MVKHKGMALYKVNYTHKGVQHMKRNKQKTPWPLARKRTKPTERLLLVGEIYCQLLRIEGCRVVSAADPSRSLILVSGPGPLLFFQVTPHLSARG
jgi:hypothetical protein